MRFISTRGGARPHSFTEAVSTGLAPDGGLFLPETLPDIRPLLKKWEGLSYADLCCGFLSLFATDIDKDELREIVLESYASFDSPEVVPLRRLDERLFVAELFHGPTLAFKDIALQLLGRLYERQVRMTGRPINVLGATSGDTGAAAIHGLMRKEGVNVFILYPDGRISPLQERQMTCTLAENIFPLAIDGSFDDAQRAIKEAFRDRVYAVDIGLSAINSINIVRVLAQSVYYLYAWLQIPEEARSNVEFVVPTGNFGNVLAGWMCRRMGLPVETFRVATNQNDIMHRFFSSGEYKEGEVVSSYAPSMDIQIASNFERYIYYKQGEDASKVRSIMDEMQRTGRYYDSGFDPGSFRSSRMDDVGILETIESVYRRYGYVLDPHTACGFGDLSSNRTNVVLSTAHPAKFPEVIQKGINVTPTHPTLDALKDREIQKYSIEPSLNSIKRFIATHQ
ncbi:MAG: threonine synthase [Opitutaceae bacterium]|nr:threonine synthase [Opitutaceae bacterium]